MKKQFSSLPLAPIALLVLSCCPAAAQRCDEYLSKSTCQVLIDMKSVRGPVTPQYKVAAPTHSDVTVNSGAAVTAVLRRASPFLACSIAATPGTPARDLSASIAGALTTFGGLVIPGELAGLEAQGETLSKAEVPLSILSVTPKEGVPPVSPEETLALVEKERKQLVGLETRTVPDLKNLYKELKDALQSYWRYSFAPDTDVEEAGQTHGQQDASAEHRARAAVDALAKKLNELLAASVPDLASIQALSKQMQDDFGTLYKGKTALTQAQADAARTVSANVGSAAAYADLLQSSASDFKKKVKQYADFVAGLNDPSRSLTLVPLPMDPYRQKTVTETITCKDAVSGTHRSLRSSSPRITKTLPYSTFPRVRSRPSCLDDRSARFPARWQILRPALGSQRRRAAIAAHSTRARHASASPVPRGPSSCRRSFSNCTPYRGSAPGPRTANSATHSATCALWAWPAALP